MKLTLDIPDDTYNLVQSTFKTKTEDEVKAHIKSRLLKWLPLLLSTDPSDRTIFLDSKERRSIEAIFQTTVENGQDLIKKVKALSSVTIGPLSFNLSPGESVRLAEQARFHGWTPEDYFKLTCTELKDRLFDRF